MKRLINKTSSITLKGWISIGACYVTMALLWSLTEANFLLFRAILPDSPLLSHAFKASGFAIAALIIIVFYKSNYIKAGFVLLDMCIIFLVYYFDPDFFREAGPFLYAPYAGLMWFFIGGILKMYYRATQLNRVTHKKHEVTQKLLNSNSEKLRVTSDKLGVTEESLTVTLEKLRVTEELLSTSQLDLKEANRINQEEEIRREIESLEKAITNIKRGGGAHKEEKIASLIEQIELLRLSSSEIH